MATGQFPPVGQPVSMNQIDAQLTNYAIQLRDLANAASNVVTAIEASSSPVLVLAAAGYSNDTASSNPSNPGGITDAAYAYQLIQLFGTLVAVYRGDATVAVATDFEQQLAVLCMGR